MELKFTDEHMGFINEAIAERDATLAKDPDNVEARYNKALMLLSIGKFSEAWPIFDVRFKVDPIFSYDWFPVPRWDGTDITGKHVLVWLEQGIGDQIMSMAMVERTAAKAASVVLMADRRFAALCRRTFPNVEFHRVGDPLPERMKTWDFDYQLSMSDMGQMFLRTGDDFNSGAFLKPDAEKVARLRHRYGKSGKPLVGISWVSQNPRYGNLKSMSPDEFKVLLQFKQFQYVVLQYGASDADIAALRAVCPDLIYDPTIDPLLNLDDSASQIAAMDLVVSVSNSTVHFAGAMGVKTLALVPIGHGRVWYWFTGYSKSPWYDSVTICRSEDHNNWMQAITKAYNGLRLYSLRENAVDLDMTA